MRPNRKDPTKMRTDSQMAELAAAEISPGPWTWDLAGKHGAEIFDSNDWVIPSLHSIDGGPPKFDTADAQFIAATREWVPAALNRLNSIRELHAPATSAKTGETFCQECTKPYPCPTVVIANKHQD